MIVHDIIKIKLSREGYLPDYPPHLISDAEMCSAFMNHVGVSDQFDWFHDNFPIPDGFEDEYQALEAKIYDELQSFIQSDNPDRELPNWLYSYMIGSVIGPNSDVIDRHNTLVLMGLDNKDDEFTSEVYYACWEASSKWLAKYGVTNRPPSLFAEPHVIKYYRLRAAI